MSARITALIPRSIPLKEDLFVLANNLEDANFSISLLELKNSVDAIPRVTLVDEFSATITYVGKALLGSLSGSAVWKIKKVDFSFDPPVITYPDGSMRFIRVWDDRLVYTYSGVE